MIIAIVWQYLNNKTTPPSQDSRSRATVYFVQKMEAVCSFRLYLNCGEQHLPFPPSMKRFVASNSLKMSSAKLRSRCTYVVLVFPALLWHLVSHEIVISDRAPQSRGRIRNAMSPDNDFMRIGISLLNFRQGAVGGIETYIRKVIEHAPSLAGEDDVVFFVHRDNLCVVPDSYKTIVVNRSQRIIDLYRILEACTFWRARSIERLITRAGVDVMLYTQQSMFPFHSTVPSVLLVADVQYLFSPQYYSWLDLRFRKSIYLRSLRRCSKIISISGVTANHLAESCHIPPNKIKVIHLGYDPTHTVPESSVHTPEYPYLYYPAVTYPHKGHANLFRSFAQLKRTGILKQKLVLSGIQSAHWKALKGIIISEGIGGEVIHMGYVSYEQVRALYRGADAVLFPTEFEGFGIPVLEAVQLQKRIICSELPIFDELGVPREWQIDYSDPQQLLKALQQEGPTRLLRDPISWKESVRRTMDLLRIAGKN